MKTTTYHYVAIYGGTSVDVFGPGMTLADAKKTAAVAFALPPGKAHLIAVALAAKDGVPVAHTADF